MKDIIEQLQLQVEEAKANPDKDLDSKSWGYEEGVLLSLNEAAAIVGFAEVAALAIKDQAKETARKVFIGIRVVHGNGLPSREQQDEYADVNWQRFLADPAKTILQMLGKL